MEFNDNKPIYRQIIDHTFGMIMGGIWRPGERIPSVRELSAELGVNSRTVLKAFDELQTLGLIEPKRGMGFLLAHDARDKVVSEKRREFFSDTIPAFRREMEGLGLTLDDIVRELRNEMKK